VVRAAAGAVAPGDVVRSSGRRGSWRRGVLPLVFATLAVLMTPVMLIKVDDYREHLEALMHEITIAAASPGLDRRATLRR
jgi:lysophospholipid acyltransferase (LPLAT)-like uncharacterized protein